MHAAWKGGTENSVLRLALQVTRTRQTMQAHTVST
jgi:hypothetical protein